MPNIHEINTAVYQLLAGDETLTDICTVFKGAKRPVNADNPSVTVDTKRLEHGGGEGIWMCDVVVISYVENLSNRMPDHEIMETITLQVREILADAEIELNGARVFPLIEGECSGPAWDSEHNYEAMQEQTFGVVFVKFD